MRNDRTNEPNRFGKANIAKLGVAIVGIGVLMALRAEIELAWMRAVLAGCAGGVLGWLLSLARRN